MTILYADQFHQHHIGQQLILNDLMRGKSEPVKFKFIFNDSSVNNASQEKKKLASLVNYNLPDSRPI